MFQQKYFTFWLSFIGLFALSWTLQSHILLNWDVSWLLYATKKSIAGGTYAHDFFDINPPMILYLYTPPVIVAKIFDLNIIMLFRLYIYGLALISFLMTVKIASSLFRQKDELGYYTFLFSYVVVITILPIHEFGQREHLLVILSAPYFLLAAARLQNQCVSFRYCILIGLLAGLGFSIKPYFFAAFILIEIYISLYKKSILTWFRPETITLTLVIFFYLLSIFVFHNDYITVVIPTAAKIYYQGIDFPWTSLLLNPIFLFCIFTILLYYFLYPKNSHKELSTILLLALLGFLFSYFIQRTLWYYHYLPAFSLAVLLITVILSSLISRLFLEKNDWVFLAFFITVIFFYPIYFVSHGYYYYLFKYKQIFFPLIDFMHKNAKGKPVYFLSTTVIYEFPIVDYAGSFPSSRFTLQTWIPTLLKNRPNQHKMSPDDQLKISDFFINIISEELNTQKPQLVFIDVQKNKPYLMGVKFEYLSYFSYNQNFKRAWKAYRYLTTIENSQLFKLDVYQRSDQLSKKV